MLTTQLTMALIVALIVCIGILALLGCLVWDQVVKRKQDALLRRLEGLEVRLKEIEGAEA